MAGNRKAAEAGVYVIADLTNGKSYVGSSEDLLKRLRRHNAMLVSGEHSNRHLQNAFNKGHVLCPIPFPINDGGNILEVEQKLIDEFMGTGKLYNFASDVSAPMKGRIHSDETKARMAEARLGIPRSAETIEKMRTANFGKTMSEESRQRMSIAQTGRALAPATVEKLRALGTGRQHSEASRLKVSEAQLNRVRTDEERENSRQRLANVAVKRWVPTTTNGVDYPSVSAAARALGIPVSTMQRHISNGVYDGAR